MQPCKFLCPLWFGRAPRSVKPSPSQYHSDLVLGLLRLLLILHLSDCLSSRSKPISIPRACCWSHICYVVVTKLPSVCSLHSKAASDISFLCLSYPLKSIYNGLFTPIWSNTGLSLIAIPYADFLHVSRSLKRMMLRAGQRARYWPSSVTAVKLTTPFHLYAPFP
jgi:hypothetical protein